MAASSRTGPVLRINPVGQLGNQMFQYMVALKIRDLVPRLEICGYDMPEWGLSEPVPEHYPDDAVHVSGVELVPVRQIARYLKRGTLSHFTLSGIGLRVGNIKDAQFYRQVFIPRQEVDPQPFDSNHIVVNVRGSEILSN